MERRSESERRKFPPDGFLCIRRKLNLLRKKKKKGGIKKGRSLKKRAKNLKGSHRKWDYLKVWRDHLAEIMKT